MTVCIHSYYSKPCMIVCIYLHTHIKRFLHDFCVYAFLAFRLSCHWKISCFLSVALTDGWGSPGVIAKTSLSPDEWWLSPVSVSCQHITHGLLHAITRLNFHKKLSLYAFVAFLCIYWRIWTFAFLCIYWRIWTLPVTCLIITCLCTK